MGSGFQLLQETWTTWKRCPYHIKQAIDLFLESKRKDDHVSKEYLKHIKVFAFKNLKEHFEEKFKAADFTEEKFNEFLRKK